MELYAPHVGKNGAHYQLNEEQLKEIEKAEKNQPYDKGWLHYHIQKPYFLTHAGNPLYIVAKRLPNKVYSGTVVRQWTIKAILLCKGTRRLE